MPDFRVIEFQLLQACNARCIYCAYNQRYATSTDYLPLKLIKKTLSRERPEWVWFEGGEVTMNEESRTYLLKAIEIAHSLGVKCRINTNAQRLTPNWTRRLVHAGLQFACVSFDSLDPNKYALLRGYNNSDGKKLLEELITNVYGLIDTGITVDLEATLTTYNQGELIRLYEYAESLSGRGRQVMMGVQCLVATYDGIFDLNPDIQSMYTSITRLSERAKTGNIPVRICCSPLVPCKYPDLYKPHPHIIWVGCSCGFDYVHVHANGDVFLCGFWDHAEPIGNLYDASLADIWETSILRKESSRIIPDNCRNCMYWEGRLRCHNLCFSVSHRKTGNFKKQSFPILYKKIGPRHNKRSLRRSIVSLNDDYDNTNERKGNMKRNI